MLHRIHVYMLHVACCMLHVHVLVCACIVSRMYVHMDIRLCPWWTALTTYVLASESRLFVPLINSVKYTGRPFSHEGFTDRQFVFNFDPPAYRTVVSKLHPIPILRPAWHRILRHIPDPFDRIVSRLVTPEPRFGIAIGD